jgi:hypothetical protein
MHKDAKGARSRPGESEHKAGAITGLHMQTFTQSTIKHCKSATLIQEQNSVEADTVHETVSTCMQVCLPLHSLEYTLLSNVQEVQGEQGKEGQRTCYQTRPRARGQQ